MLQFDTQEYSQSVQRRIPGNVKLICGLLYIAVAVFALAGMAGGLVWGVLAVGTLVFAWYFMGQARVTYIYRLEGTRLSVQRVSGFKSRPRKADFAQLELTRLSVMAPEGSPCLDEAEARTAALKPRRITYDVSAHDPDRGCSVMYLEGVEAEAGRWLKVYIQPDAELRQRVAAIGPGRVRGYEDAFEAR